MSSQQRLAGIGAVVLGYIVKFMAYSVLTTAVLVTFSALVAAYIIIMGPEIPFLQYLAFMLPIDARGNATIDEDDIMQIYGMISMILFVLSIAGGWLMSVLKRTLKQMSHLDEGESEPESILPNQNLISSGKRKLIVASALITAIYLVLFVAIPFARMAQGTSHMGMFLVCVVFYIVALISNAIYTVVDSLSELALGWGWAKVLSG
ncbi:MAG TPA: hypothetical protein VHP14_19005 [Anaerolineales bacterium]|nr:hypothetical protein [Anaerolineales bacterium]